MNSIDLLVQNYFSLNRTSYLTDFFYILTEFFNASFSFALILICLGFLIYKVRGIRYSLFFLTTFISGAVIIYFLKIFFNVNRPTDALFLVNGQSFPSYHATMATIFFIILMYVFDDYFKKGARFVFNTLCIISIFLIALSRVYLGVHWVSDVIFGVIIGTSISYIAICLFRYFQSRRKN